MTTPSGPDPVAVWRRMLEIHADLVQDLEERFIEDHDLTATEFDVLINIRPGGAVRHRDLLERIVLSRSGLSRLLRRMDDRGLVTQSPDTADRRGVEVRLTEHGARLRRAAARTNAAMVRHAFRGLSSPELATLLEHVDQIRPRNRTHDPTTNAPLD